jgi:RHS repeat-associated protein
VWISYATVVTLTIDGDDVAESTTTLDSLGIAAGERAQLDTAFATGTALWRLSTDHFSPLDLNYPVVLGGPAPEVNIRDRSDCSTIRNHSIIECENQLLGEIIPLVGTEFALTYRSSRSPGWTDGYAFTMELISDSIPDLLGIVLSVTVAGRTFVDSFPSTPNQQHTYAWDGRDAFGRPVQGRQPALIKLEYRYPRYYSIPAATAASFGLTCQGTTGQGMSACIIPQTLSSAGRSEGRRIAAEAGVLGTWDARDAGVGGWSLTAHHTYNPAASVLQFGDGSMRSAPPAQPLIVNFAGAVDGYSGDGGPAADAGLSDPTGLAVADDGSVYIADSGNHRIRRVSPDGIISTVAGTGTAGFGGDGGSATQAMLDTPWGVAVAPDGSIYIGDDNHRIRRVDSLGVITTIAGTGTYGFSGDGGPAIDANLKFPRLLKFAPDGTLYFADGGIFDTHRLRKIDPSGLISTVMPTSYCDVFSENCGDGIPAYQAGFYQLLGLDVGDDGSVYLADGNFLIRRIKPDGEIETIAGVPGQFIHTPSGISADSASIDVPEGILARRDGSVVFGELGSIGGLRGIDQRGFLVDVAGNGDSSCPAATQPGCGDGEIATSAYVTGDHWDIVEGPDGTIYFNNALGAAGAGRVRRLLPWLPQLDTASHSAASEDGSELYLFSSDGRHLETRSTLTGSLLYLFGYDAAGRLTSVEDADSLVTTIERDTNGQPTAIVSPYGQRTELDVDSASYLVQLRTPASDTVQLAYSTGGQLISLTDPNGNEKTYTYDSFGRLVADEDELGGSIDLTPTFSLNGVSVALETTLGRTGTYLLETRTDGAERRVQTAPDGTVAERITTVRDSTWSLSPDSTVTTVTRRADPRFGPQARYPTSASVRLPSSLQLSLTAGRQATLSDSTNPLSLLTLLDSVIVNGRKYTSSYAQSTRTYTHTTPTGRMTVERLDSLGRIVSDSVAGLLPWTYTWDSNGRLSQAQQGSRVFEYAYDNLGRLETVTDPLDQVTEFEYDAAGRLTRQVLPDTNEIAFGWDRNGNLTSLTPPGRPAHTFTYDAVNQMASYAAPDLGSGASTTEYTFDLDRQLTSILRPDSTEITMAYDTAGRIATVTIPRGSYDYSYSPTTGQLTGISSPDSVALAYTYDGALVTGVEWSGQVNGTVDVTYDDDFRVVKQRVNGTDSVAYQYDNDGLMTAAGALTMTRNSANGLLTGTTLGSVTTSQTYDAFGGLATYTASYSGNTLFQTTYTRDALGRITRLIETIQGVTDTLDYTYDLVGRLTTVDRNGVTLESYTYDANGNRTSFTGPSGTVNATYDDQDRLLTYGNATYSYTAAGELTRTIIGSDTTDYAYDALGNLVGVTLQTGTGMEYLIDGQDRRIRRKVGGQVLDGLLYGDRLNPVTRLDSLGNPAAHFVYGSRPNVPDYLIQGGTTYRLITNHLGTVRLVVNVSTGQIVQRIDYDAFGQTIQNTQPDFQPFSFAGGLSDDDSGLVRFGFRDYDPATGRWTTPDPLRYWGGSSNLFTYAVEDPVNFIDPDGLQPNPIAAGFVVGAGFGALGSAAGQFIGSGFNLAYS